MSEAKEFKCSKKSCDKQADVFIQGTDPDLTLNLPLCEKHANKYRFIIMMAMYGDFDVDDIDKWLNE